MPVQRVTLQPKCPECQKSAVEVFRYFDKVTNKTAVVLKCGHITTEEHTKAREDVFFESMDGYRPFKFQEESAVFAIERANCRVLFGHEPGLGKTICAFRTLSMMDPEKAYPVLWVVKSALIPQFFTQIVKWLGYEHVPQIIERSADIPFKGFKHCIVSYDMLPRMFKLHGDDVFAKVGFKTLVLDECQMIKNFGAKRTKALFKVSKGMDNIMALSGTPILNNASEYFPILHLLRPAKFPNYEGFIRYWLNTYRDGSYLKLRGLRNPQKFKDYTEDFIIRFKKEEVLKDLPPINRGFHYCNMDDDLMEAHDKIVKEFGDAYAIDPGMSATNILAYMSKMRHLTGLSKIESTLDLIKEHLTNTDRKLVVFVHHIDVGDLMLTKLNRWLEENKMQPAVRFEGGMGNEKIKDALEKFGNGSRVMIASTLAAGEGLNLQFCSDCILHERQWNPPKEDQAFDRFHRIGQLNPVNVRMMIALGTIDEVLTEKVEVKRRHLKEALDNEEYHWDETALAKDLAEAMMQRASKIAVKRNTGKSVEEVVEDKIKSLMAEEKFVDDLKKDLMNDVEENGDEDE